MILSETITLPLPNILGPCPYKTGPNETTRKWAVVKGLNKMDQKIKFLYFGSCEGRISHYKVV